jgi:phage head maturation protease
MKSLNLVCEAKLLLSEAEDGQEKSGLIEACVTTWGAREGADGRKFFYTQEGFAAWAGEFAATSRPLPMFVNHNADSIPVGEWTDFDFSETGMTAKGRIYTETTQGADLYHVMKVSPEMFGGVSVGAYADEYTWVSAEGIPLTAGSDDDGFFQITAGGLREVSVVMYPNNPQAEVSKLEFFREDGTADLKILESALRDAGLSKSEAVAAASVFKKVLERRDVVQDQIEAAPTQSESDVEATNALLAALEKRELLRELSKRI